MQITSSKYIISAPDLAHCPYHDQAEFAFIGRSNVGKSSLINAVANNTSLAKTSSTPGKTRLINFFLTNKSFYIVDLPGYGYAKTSKTNRQQWVDASSEYLAGRKQIKHLFILLDFRHKPQDIDLEFINWVNEQNIDFTIIATKKDKLNQKENATQLKIFGQLALVLQLKNPVLYTSAVKKEGTDKIRQVMGLNLK